ncbi:MAG: universal stress protein [Xenophilus sp.]
MYQRILVPVDGSATSREGLDEAIRLARLTGGQLRLIHVVDELSLAVGMGAYAGPIEGWADELRAAGQKVLDEAGAAAKAAGVPFDTALNDNIGAPVTDVVLHEAQRWPAELLVLGTHGRRGVGRLLLGSSAEAIVRAATVPVLLVRAPEGVAPQAEDGKKITIHQPTGALRIE